MEIEAQPLVDDGEKYDSLMKTRRSKKGSQLRSLAVVITTHGLVALFVFVAVRYSPMAASVSRHEDLSVKAQRTLYSPLEPAVQYSIDNPPENSWSNDLYFGSPSDASERAWNEVIHLHGLQFSPEEVEHLNNTDTLLLENGNYLFILGLYHNLHCMRRIRQTLQADHYYPDMTAEQRQHDREHTGHCLEAIRTSIMCHPDLTPNRYYWSGRPWHDLSVHPAFTRECVNWSILEDFVNERGYDPDTIVKGHDKVIADE